MTAQKKATAPAPPRTSFTGEVPRKPVAQQFSEWRKIRRAERLSKPKRPVHIHLGGSQSSTQSSGSGTRRKRRATRLPRGHSYARRRPRRGAIAGILGVTVAAAVLTCAVVELVSWTAASELTLAAEGVTMFTAWCFGEPSDRSKLKKAQQAGQQPKAPRQRQQSQPQGSGGHKCGAATQGGKGAPCQRPVSKAGEHCWEHPGGKSSAQTPAAATGSSPRKSGPKTTKKGASPPPASTPTP